MRRKEIQHPTIYEDDPLFVATMGPYFEYLGTAAKMAPAHWRALAKRLNLYFVKKAVQEAADDLEDSGTAS
jgi:hypothetical protein